ncbi:MAG TPA: ribosome recycling factor, partial [Leptospiraceae bacterium]|nr:ribosome recycling factor [Leptospiraceae bacterium]
MKKILESAKLEMREAVEHLSDEFFRIFPEQADSRLLEGIQVDYYGVLSSILHISHFSILDSTVSMLQPFDKNMTAQIEKSISESDRDILTEIIGDKIFLKLSPLTGEIRKRK